MTKKSNPTDKQKKARKRNWALMRTMGMITTLDHFEKTHINSVALQVELCKARNALTAFQKEIESSDVESWKA